jgi:hypothetical protein
MNQIRPGRNMFNERTGSVPCRHKPSEVVGQGELYKADVAFMW